MNVKQAGKKGGRNRSGKKIIAARRNGKLGGRPRIIMPKERK